ncbi:hypothetical protein Q8F55_009054 [Vanrija albida]|uniref:Uncharacterized protein n=1 Tax=Vanrija albida TaxID=181172 RepID=A0ABR3PTI4_9TREE
MTKLALLAFLAAAAASPLTPRQNIFGSCLGQCSTIISFIGNACDGKTDEQCASFCLELKGKSGHLAELNDCNTCIQAEATVDSATKTSISGWAARMDGVCRYDECTTPCTPIFSDMRAACLVDNPEGCHDLCTRKDSVDTCRTCTIASSGSGAQSLNFDLSHAAMSLDFWCTPCGSDCLLFRQEAKGCVFPVGTADCSATCSAANTALYEKCLQCTKSQTQFATDLTADQRFSTEGGLKRYGDACKQTTTDPTKGTACDGVCKDTLAKFRSLCNGGEKAKCEEMCIDTCNSCVQDASSDTSEDDRKKLQTATVALRNWCGGNKDREGDVAKVPNMPDTVVGGPTTAPPDGGTKTPPGDGGSAPPTGGGGTNPPSEGGGTGTGTDNGTGTGTGTGTGSNTGTGTGTGNTGSGSIPGSGSGSGSATPSSTRSGALVNYMSSSSVVGAFVVVVLAFIA